MNLESFAHTVEWHQPVVIVLTSEDYRQLQQALPETPNGNWNKALMQYRGRPIVGTEFRHSYVVEDTPDGPVFHMLAP